MGDLMPDFTAWPRGPERPRLPGDEVHVWRASLTVSGAKLDRLFRTLHPEERARADSFRFQHDREHFVAAHGFLRALLARYLETSPDEVRIEMGAHGKPGLTSADPPLRFNLSHSGSLAVYAFAAGREVGVDVEQIRPDIDGAAIAENFFAPGELASLNELPAGRCQAGFYACWTRKEAYVKARGEGLGIALDSFEVPVSPSLDADIMRLDAAGACPGWSLADLDLGPEYAGAVVTEGSLKLRLWSL